MATLTTLTDGLFGGVAGAVGAFAAAALTVALTRRADRRRELTRVAERDQERRAELIAKLVGTLRALESEVRFAPFMSGRTESELLQFLSMFIATERRAHPAVVEWLVTRHTAYGHIMARWRRVWWVPLVRRRRMRAVGEHLGQTITAIDFWVIGDVGDAWFEKRAGGSHES